MYINKKLYTIGNNTTLLLLRPTNCSVIRNTKRGES